MIYDGYYSHQSYCYYQIILILTHGCGDLCPLASNGSGDGRLQLVSMSCLDAEANGRCFCVVV